MFTGMQFDRVKFEAERAKSDARYKMKRELAELMIAASDEAEKPCAQFPLLHNEIRKVLDDFLADGSMLLGLANDIPEGMEGEDEIREQVNAYFRSLIDPLSDIHHRLSGLYENTPLPEFVNQPKND